jgi:hypothetical protein
MFDFLRNLINMVSNTFYIFLQQISTRDNFFQKWSIYDEENLRLKTNAENFIPSTCDKNFSIESKNLQSLTWILEVKKIWPWNY